MKPTIRHRLASQLACWKRKHVAVRGGLHATRPAPIRSHLGLRRGRVRQGVFDATPASLRMLCLSIDTALDEALPWFARSVCVAGCVKQARDSLVAVPPAQRLDMVRG